MDGFALGFAEPLRDSLGARAGGRDGAADGKRFARSPRGRLDDLTDTKDAVDEYYRRRRWRESSGAKIDEMDLELYRQAYFVSFMEVVHPGYSEASTG